MSESFTQKAITVVLQIGTGAFGETGSNTVTLSGLRVSAEINNVGAPSMGTAEIRVYGLQPQIINQLTTLGLQPLRTRDNRVTILAGDDVVGMSMVYQGTIDEAWPDFNGQPETFFYIRGLDGLLSAVKPIPPSSYQGGADAGVMLKSIAAQMGNYVFENNGVSVKLSNAYFPGTAFQQFAACAAAAHVDWTIEKGVIAIWPKGSARAGAVPVISPATGMIGYPSFASQAGIALRCLYNPAIRFGGEIEVQSILQPACGTWFVRKLSHKIESQTPGGDWMSSLETVRTAIVVQGGTGADVAQA